MLKAFLSQATTRGASNGNKYMFGIQSIHTINRILGSSPSFIEKADIIGTRIVATAGADGIIAININVIAAATINNTKIGISVILSKNKPAT